MNLSPHFTLKEATETSAGLENTPSNSMIAVLIKTAAHMEIVRGILNCAIDVTSWLRSVLVNRAVGGSETSGHLKGFCVDFRAPKFGSAYDVVQALRGCVMFDQLIWEHPPGKGPWVHISFDPRMRGQVLQWDGEHYTELTE